MRKTEIARKAFYIYSSKNRLFLIPYFAILVFILMLPTALLFELYENYSNWFMIAIIIFMYFSFPIWFGIFFTFVLLVDGINLVLGIKPNIVNPDGTFSDAVYRLLGAKLKD